MNRVAGSGYVLRDSEGVLIEGGCHRHLRVVDPFISELLALRDGLEAAVRRNLAQVIVQTDCASLVSLWQYPRQLRMEGSHILIELKKTRAMRSRLSSFFNYLNRSANFAAHTCAKEALSIVNPFCFDVTPGFLLRVIQADCNPVTSV